MCNALSIVNTSRALSRLDEDEKDIHSVNTLGGEQKLSTINESGLYSLILTSRKLEAKKFKKWVTNEVLPSIRKTGKYEHPNHQPEARELLTADDTSHLSRLIWTMANGFRFERSWTQGLWYALR
ncbi:MAG: Bro-N domain-containing protein, partial [Arsenophonus sp.]|nr:Bro-N domain-containing protein [Arsenophonus sp.]